MIFAIPIMIAGAFFLSSCLFKLTVHALPLFVAVTTALCLSHAGLGFGTALICGGLVALAALTCGRMMFAEVILPLLRLKILTVFAALHQSPPIMPSWALPHRSLAPRWYVPWQRRSLPSWSDERRGGPSPAKGCAVLSRDVAQKPMSPSGSFWSPMTTKGGIGSASVANFSGQ